MSTSGKYTITHLIQKWDVTLYNISIHIYCRLELRCWEIGTRLSSPHCINKISYRVKTLFCFILFCRCLEDVTLNDDLVSDFNLYYKPIPRIITFHLQHPLIKLRASKVVLRINTYGMARRCLNFEIIWTSRCTMSHSI